MRTMIVDAPDAATLRLGLVASTSCDWIDDERRASRRAREGAAYTQLDRVPWERAAARIRDGHIGAVLFLGVGEEGHDHRQGDAEFRFVGHVRDPEAPAVLPCGRRVSPPCGGGA